jgi:hypothetical protein
MGGVIFNLNLFVKTSGPLLFVVLALWGHIQVSLSFFFAAIFQSSRTATGNF